MTASITRDLIIEKLSTVYDPEIPVNIWELVKNWEHLDTALKKRRKNPEKRNSNPQFADADNV